MKLSHLFLALIGLTAFIYGSLHAEDVPKRFAFDRYAGMLNRSPFAVATEVAPQPTPNFAKDLFIANAAHTGNGDFVTISSAVDRGLHEYLSTTEPNPHGYKIISIEWSDRPGETKVTISKDGQVATLAFNQALMSQMPPPPAQPQPQPMQPNPGVPMPGGYNAPKPAVPLPAAMPNATVPVAPTPHTRGVIQRIPNSTSANSPRPAVRSAQLQRD